MKHNGMIYSWLIVCILVLGCIGQSPQEPAHEQEGEPGGSNPYMDVTDDEILQLTEQMSPVILYWYSSTCSTCLTVKPLVEELQKEYNLDIIWVNKNENKSIFELYHIRYYPSIYVYDQSEVFITFDANDSLTAIYSQILDSTITGMNRIDYTVEGSLISIPNKTLLPDTLYYLSYEDHRIFVFISTSGRLFVFTKSRNCGFNWLFLKKDLIYDGEHPAQWDRKTLEEHRGGCGEILEIPYSVTGGAVIIDVEDIVW